MIAQVRTLTVHLLQLRKRSIFTWSIAVALYMLAIIAVYTSFAGFDFDALLDQYPPELKSMFGIEGSLNFSTAMGYLNVELFSLMMPLALAFLPIGIASAALAAAEDARYLDVLFGAPVARQALLVAVGITSAIALAVVLTVTALGGWVFAQVIGVELSFTDFGLACAAVWPLALFFGALAILTAAITPHRGRTVAIASGVLIAMYLCNGLAPMVDFLDRMSVVSVFRYYSQWIQDGVDGVQFVLMTLAGVALVALAAPLYRRRDIIG
ncbi:MAG: ABC transporter permease subunit [Thermoleophilaceae bacterium]|nr:ABC transporter permease subunit [Thermoleophilaceae bacterium]